jgi:hypothetical protein
VLLPFQSGGVSQGSSKQSSASCLLFALSLLAFSSLQMVVIYSSETLVNFYWTIYTFWAVHDVDYFPLGFYAVWSYRPILDVSQEHSAPSSVLNPEDGDSMFLWDVPRMWRQYVPPKLWASVCKITRCHNPEENDLLDCTASYPRRQDSYLFSSLFFASFPLYFSLYSFSFFSILFLVHVFSLQ